MPKGWNAKYEDPEDMRRDIESYFHECDTRRTTRMTRTGLVNEPDPEAYTVAGIALACNMTKACLSNYKYIDGFREVLEWAYQRLERQWTAFTARPNNNGGAIFYLGNVFKGEYTSQMSVNVGGQAGNPVQTVTRTDKDRLAECSTEELEAIERILMEAERRGGSND